ncbi:diaminopimelate epimerase [Silanimonas sp.]|uniref:diaminopimelate epimerase n=1 Tax=Silanimonas sp. TaxID=1929290 RepID=UPI001BBBD936|nr:diaminopimelate epimerase [Silanimonas sp.]MBS3896487.1 diaminopimelate epimerase [Silanimonas sp.]MBS3924429.1 diaminopimelate epimerase [Xanthomonadaceae bacterium]
MNTAAARRRFSKMHGAGNDFVLLDLRQGEPPPPPAEVARMADRHRGIGFDQLLTVEAATSPGALAAYRIWNADGSIAGQCGNGARCVAAWLRRDGVPMAQRFRLDSPDGPVEAELRADGEVAIVLGHPRFAPAEVPLRLEGPGPEHRLATPWGELRFGAVSMGNPHAVIEVAELAATDVAGIARWLQAQAVFPEGVNVGFAEVRADDRIALRVYERGAGETLACGSGACAAVAVLVRRGRVGRTVQVDLPGGRLRIDWPTDDAPLRMTGPAAFVFDGEWIP